jgi:hypothetical protein
MIELALTRAYDAVVAQFAADGTVCEFGFGWRESQKQSPGPRRIVWQPGDASGAVGAVGPARFPGRNPRPLGTLAELVTVFVEAYDANDPENERAQYQATRELFDAWYRAMHLAAYGTFSIASSKWDASKNLRRRGAMIVALVEVQSMIPDAPLETAPADTEASITPSLDAVDDGTGTADPTFTVTATP